MWVPPWLSGFVCAYQPATPGLSPKHTIYAFFIYSQNLCYICPEKRTKNNKKRPGLVHLFKKRLDTGHSCNDQASVLIKASIKLNNYENTLAYLMVKF